MFTTLLPMLLRDGLLACLLLSVLVIGSLLVNPRLFLQDYPAEIRSLVPPLTPSEKRTQRWLMLPILCAMFGIPFLVGRHVRFELGGEATFLSVYAGVALVTNLINLWDALVLDLLVLTLPKPRFARLPGTEHLDHLYADMRLGLQVRNFFKGVVIVSLLSVVIAAAAML
jgi:hypothetical protein